MRHLTSVENRIVEALKNGSPMKYADLRKLAGGNRAIKTLADDGLIERLPMGLYTVVSDTRDTTHESFAALSIRRPDIVICFDSAAAYHGLTVENPSEVWLAVPYESSPPRGNGNIQIRGSRWNERSMSAGVIEVDIAGVPVRITNPARTVVDLLRFSKSRGGEEMAGDALATYASRHNMGDLVRIAKELGCEASIRPRLAFVQSQRSHR